MKPWHQLQHLGEVEKLRERGNVNLVAIILFGIVLMILFVLLFVHRVSLEVSETILSVQSPELVAEKLAKEESLLILVL